MSNAYTPKSKCGKIMGNSADRKKSFFNGFLGPFRSLTTTCQKGTTSFIGEFARISPHQRCRMDMAVSTYCWRGVSQLWGIHSSFFSELIEMTSPSILTVILALSKVKTTSCLLMFFKTLPLNLSQS